MEYLKVLTGLMMRCANNGNHHNHAAGWWCPYSYPELALEIAIIDDPLAFFFFFPVTRPTSRYPPHPTAFQCTNGRALGRQPRRQSEFCGRNRGRRWCDFRAHPWTGSSTNTPDATPHRHGTPTGGLARGLLCSTLRDSRDQLVANSGPALVVASDDPVSVPPAVPDAEVHSPCTNRPS